MSKKRADPPFLQSIRSLVENLGISADEATQRVQAYYSDFKNRNDRLMERQNDAANSVLTNFNNQITLVATATLAFSGALVGSVYKGLTTAHIIIFIFIAVVELIALTLTLIDYVNTALFHARWAKTYYDISNEVDQIISSGNLMDTSQLADIELEYINKNRHSTTKILMYCSLVCTMVGAWLFLILLLAYFFDMPFYK